MWTAPTAAKRGVLYRASLNLGRKDGWSPAMDNATFIMYKTFIREVSVQVARFLVKNVWDRYLLSLFHPGIKLMVDGIYRRLKSRGIVFVQRRKPLGHVHGNHAAWSMQTCIPPWWGVHTWLYPTCLFSKTLILYIYFQGCVERCVFMGVRSAAPPSRHRGWQAESLLFGCRLFRCCASLRPPSES